ncbi:MAG: UDP-N-acetylmuramoyl-L-alanyl-D-glutamate--2,6-diaminopimelate ligase [Clostridiales bacterium]|nr:UDP-N-acetylmuramoyl-L-alanyl-D-glutamate--2,6-diaminopimelate ligase [Clostridiales bacterium]
MRLSELLKGTQVLNKYTDREILGVTDKSDDVKPGWVFVCIRGAKFDGSNFARRAFEMGAAAIVAESDTGESNTVIVENVRSAYALMCAEFFGNPSKKLRLIGITGTNGKTSTAFFLKEILENLGHRCGLMGTVKNMAGERDYPSGLTTPEPYTLNNMFAEMVAQGCEFCIMEVSSQALDQHRVDGCRFEAAVFTNLEQDHLDYHKTAENYFLAKRRLFEQTDIAIVNLDDASAGRMTDGLDCRTVSFSVNTDESDYTAKNVRLKRDCAEYELVCSEDIGRVSCCVPGMFSVYNSMGAAVCAIQLGEDFHDVLEAVKRTHGIKGRMEVVETGRDFTVIIDYAHTPDGLEKVLTAINGFKTGKLITVFGCGGDRDRTKRPVMGRIASELSDMVIITSDNPRTEAPLEIIREIMSGIDETDAAIISMADRTSAIKCALTQAQTGDTVLLAGKGHETYQILGTEKIDFDERKKISEIIDEIG